MQFCNVTFLYEFVLVLFLFLVVNTYCHADHITSTGLMKERVDGLKSAISRFSGAAADIKLSEGDEVKFGKFVRKMKIQLFFYYYSF